jgi:hypothetical protein
VFSHTILYEFEYKKVTNETYNETINGTSFERIKESTQLNVSFTEVLVFIWVISLLFEELRQVRVVQNAISNRNSSFSSFYRLKFTLRSTVRQRAWKQKLQEYLQSSWNKADLIFCGIFFLGCTLRLVSLGSSEGVFIWAK